MKKKLNRVLSMLMVVLMLVSMLPTNVLAETSASNTSSGVGATGGVPYVLSTVSDDEGYLVPYFTSVVETTDDGDWDASIAIKFAINPDALLSTKTDANGNEVKEPITVWHFNLLSDLHIADWSNMETDGDVYVGGVKSGTFTLDENGKFVITFDKDYVLRQTENVKGLAGELTVSGRWDDSDSEGKDVVTITLGGKDYYIYPHGEGNVDISKSLNNKYSIADGEVIWKIEVTSQDGTASDITLTDTLPSGSTVTKVEVYAADGEVVTYTGAALTTGENPIVSGDTVTLTLDPLPYNNGNVGTHTVYITTDLERATATSSAADSNNNKKLSTTNLDKTNTAKAETTGYDGQLKTDAATAKVTDPAISVTKGNPGTIGAGDVIGWNITVNPNNANIAGLTLSDDALSEAISFSITPNSNYTRNADGSITFNADSNGVNNSSYTISYTVKATPDADGAYTYTNSNGVSKSVTGVYTVDDNHVYLKDGDTLIAKDYDFQFYTYTGGGFLSKTSDYDQVNNEVTYTININNNGLNVANITTLNDVFKITVNGVTKEYDPDNLPEGFSFKTGSISATRNGSAISLSDTTSIENALNSLVEAIKEDNTGNQNYNKYSLTYTVNVPAADEGSIQNFAQVKFDQFEVGVGTGAITLTGIPVASKASVQNDDSIQNTYDRYKWKLVINPLHAPMNGWTITDEITGLPSYLVNKSGQQQDVTRISADGTRGETVHWSYTTLEDMCAALNSMMKDGCTDSIEVIYRTTIESIGRVTNTVYITVNGVKKDIYAEDTYVYPDGVAKAGTGAVYNEEEQVYELGWKTKFTLQKSLDLPETTATISDTFSDGQYMTDEDAAGLETNVAARFGLVKDQDDGFTITYTRDAENKITGFVITLKQIPRETRSGNAQYFNYTTRVPAEGVSSVYSNTVTEQVGTQTQKSATGYNVVQDQINLVKKFTGPLNADGNASADQLKWEISLVIPKGAEKKHIVITDNLPSNDVVLTRGQVKIADETIIDLVATDNNGTLGTKTVRKVKFSSPYNDDVDVRLRINTDHAYEAGDEIKITLWGRLKDAAVDAQTITNTANTTITYANKVTFNDSAECSVSVVKPEKVLKIDKTGEKLTEKQNTVKWSVKINEEGAELLTDAATLYAVDELTWSGSSAVTASSFELQADTVKLFYLDENGEKAGEVSGWGYTHTSTSSAHIINLTGLPNGKPMLFEYEYKLLLTENAPGLKLSNHFQFNGYENGEGDGEVIEGERFVVGTVVAYDYEVAFFKYADGNQNERLAGAEFDLYAWENNDWTKLETRTSDENGRLAFQTVYVENKAYKLVETKAPDGYQKPNYTYIFSFGEPEGYTGTYDNRSKGLSVWINNESIKTEAAVKKVWNDGNNQDGIRPASLKVNLMNGDAVVDSVILTEDNNWTATITDLKKYADDGTTEIKYTWEEVDLPEGYELTNTSVSSTQTTLTNSHTPETISIPVTKTWETDLWGNECPDSITVKLYDDTDPNSEGDPIRTITVTAANDWKGSFTNLPKYRNNGTEIQYHVVEDVPAGFEADIDGDNSGYTLNNCLTKIDIKVDKEWLNGNTNGEDNLEVTVYLLNNGEKIMKGEEVRSETIGKLNKANNWTYTFEDLPEYINGNKAVYSVKEEAVEGYQQTANTGSAANGFKITNTELTEASVVKVWSDSNDQDGVRPDTLTVNLLANNGATSKSVTLTKDDNWAQKTISNLLKYDENNTEIIYTWQEDTLPTGYTLTDTSVNGTLTTLTNSYDVKTTEATVKKVWDDKNNQDNVRPASLTVTLSDGEKTVGTVTLSESNGWTGKITNLPVYRNGGQAITYTWTEGTMPEGYKLTNTSVNGTITTLTNSRAPETVDIEGSKAWVDNGNEDQRPETITIRLLADGKAATYQDGTAVEPVELTITNNVDSYNYKFTKLPKYKVGAVGQKITYTVTEDTVDNYTTGIVGYEITNTLSQETTEVEGKKTWDNNGYTLNNYTVPAITIELYRDNEAEAIDYVTLNSVTLEKAKAEIEYKFENLPKYAVPCDALAEGGKYAYTGNLDGHTFVYTVKEVIPAAYKNAFAADDSKAPNFTNTLRTVEVKGTKTWIYYGEEELTVFPELTIKLLANGKEFDTQVLKDGDKEYAFTNLPEYDEQGGKITYTVEEVVPVGYSLTKSVANTTLGADFTNTLETVKVSGKKSWSAGLTETPTIEIKLYRQIGAGEKTCVATETLKNGDLTYEFVNLPKYAVPCDALEDVPAAELTGAVITYTVEEVILVDNAAKAFESTPDAVGDYQVNFTNNLVTTELNGEKMWEDFGNEITHPDVVIELYRDDEEDPIASVTLKDGEEKFSFTNLPMYAVAKFAATDDYAAYTGAIDGHKFNYTIEEVVPLGYTSDELQGAVGFINTLEVVEVEGTKTWIDDGNETLRPETITIQLYRDDVLYKTETLTKDTAKDEFEYSFKNLPKYRIPGLADGKDYPYTANAREEFIYRVEEVIPGYYADAYESAKAEGTNDFTNTLKTTEVEGVKTWLHSGEAIETYPAITIVLKQDGEEYDRKELAANGETTCEFTNLPAIDPATGKAHVYTVEEIIPEAYRDGYESVTTGDMADGYEITNNLVTVNVSGKKIWDGNNNTITRVPAIKVELLRDGEVIDTASLANGTTTYAFNSLPKYAVPCDALASYTKGFDGHAFEYTVREVIEEDHKAGYVPAEEANATLGEDFTNTLVTTEVNGTKSWNDFGNEITHPDVVIELYRDEETAPIATRTLTDGVTTYSFTDLPKFAVANFADANGYIGYTGAIDGHEFKYSVKEVVPHGYTSEQDDTAFTNTLEVVEVKGTKTWIDLGNETERPETITINLMRDSVEYKEVVIEINEEDKTYEFSFTNLPKYAIAGLADAKESDVLDGHEFTYTVTEDAVAKYDTAINGYDVTNTISRKFTELTGEKTWIDGNDEAGKRPSSIIIRLFRDGEQIDVATVTEESGWAWKFDKLAVYAVDVADKGAYSYEDADGHTFVYTVTEDAVENYSTIQNVNDFTNTIVQDYTDVIGEKTWIDFENEDGKRPASITVNLMRDGVEIDEVTVGEEEGWAWEFKDLPMYAVEPIDGKTVVYPYDARDGHTFKYTVTEDAVDAYTTEIEGFDVVNTLVQEYLEVSGTKTWVDPTGTEHDPITINLLRDGVEVKEVVLENGVVNYTFDTLPKYAVPCAELADYTGELDGHIFTYTVTEDVVPGYTTVQRDTNFINTIEQEWIPVTVTKIWVDNGAVDVEHPAITVHLLRNGYEVASATLANGVTSHTFENLPKYNLGTGQIHTYTVVEDPVEGYTTTIAGLTITNTTEAPEMITISGTKTWFGDNGAGHNNAAEVKLTLTRRVSGGKVEVVNAPIVWDGATYSFHNLLKADETGRNYIYSVREDAVEGYETFYQGYNITNRKVYDVTTVSVNGTKFWHDDDNAAGIRPEQVVVQLLRDGNVIDTAVVNADGNWTYTFDNLPDNDGYGRYYTYTVSEQMVPGYWLRVEGYDLHNTPQIFEPVTFSRFREEELEDLLDIFDYGVPLWGGLLGTGDEIPVYPFAFGGLGLLALVAYLLYNRKRKNT